MPAITTNKYGWTSSAVVSALMKSSIKGDADVPKRLFKACAAIV